MPAPLIHIIAYFTLRLHGFTLSTNKPAPMDGVTGCRHLNTIGIHLVSSIPTMKQATVPGDSEFQQELACSYTDLEVKASLISYVFNCKRYSLHDGLQWLQNG